MSAIAIIISVLSLPIYLLIFSGIWADTNGAMLWTSSSKGLKGTEVVMFNAVFRHGNRTPEALEAANFPNSPYDESIFFPYGLGQLTNAGKTRAFALGQHLRRRYDDLLSPIYIVDQIRMRTTDYDRTKMSGMLVYAGLYPPQNLQRWNPYLDWQPIPFDTLPRENDFLLALDSCPQYKLAGYAKLGSPEVLAVFDTFKDVTSKLSIYTGAEMNGFMSVVGLYQTLLGQMGVGRPIPSWARKLLPIIKEINDLAFSIINFDDELVTLSSGPLLNELLTNMQTAAASGAPTRRAYLYSVHDLNVAALMATIGVFDDTQPDYSSMFTLELRKNTFTEDYGVVALYTRDALLEPEVLLIPGCPQVFCPLDIFAEVASKYAITEEQFNELCIVSI